jgi:NADH-quinone oxidoreductase subunit J
MFETWLFFAFAAVLLVSGVLVITARNPVHGVLFLVLAFFTAAGIWLLLRAEFLAIALVVVYVGAVMVLFLFVVMMLDSAAPRPVAADYSNTKELGRVLYTQYAYAFEIAAVLLLVAIIAAIALTLRQRKDSRSQDPAAQTRVRRADRVRLVAMKTERE